MMKTVMAFIFFVIMMPTPVFAEPGRYKLTLQSENLKPAILNQEMCLLKNGTWYSASYPGWSGKWFKIGKNLRMHGNFEFNLVNGNDSIELTKILPKLLTGYWQEWMDDGSYENYITVKFEKMGNYCSQPAPLRTARPKGRPASIQ
jgi:hypothetical protein